MKTKEYIPKPIDTSKVNVSTEILGLIELLARNVHENWATERLKQGWKYGRKRNDENKEHPCLIPYDELSQKEKDYDRKTAMETVKVILGMGWEIKKK